VTASMFASAEPNGAPAPIANCSAVPLVWRVADPSTFALDPVNTFFSLPPCVAIHSTQQ
jgi:hypothetical protein